MDILSQMAVVALIGAVGWVFLVMFRKSGAEGTRWSPEPEEEEGEKTVMPPLLWVEQLNPRTMEPVKRFEIREIPPLGVTISRPNAKQGMIRLDPSVRAAFSVSREHARIGMDSSGLFIQDQRGDGRMWLAADRQVVDEVDITDGLILFLGAQPLRFLIPDLWDSWENGDITAFFGYPDADPADGDTRIFTRRY